MGYLGFLKHCIIIFVVKFLKNVVSVLKNDAKKLKIFLRTFLRS